MGGTRVMAVKKAAVIKSDRKPVVIAGFEPLDVMQAIKMLIRQVNEGRAEVENEFSRAVDRNGNLKAQQLVAEVFEMRKNFEWRGLNILPYSALRIRSQFAEFDAEKVSSNVCRPICCKASRSFNPTDSIRYCSIAFFLLFSYN